VLMYPLWGYPRAHGVLSAYVAVGDAQGALAMIGEVVGDESTVGLTDQRCTLILTPTIESIAGALDLDERRVQLDVVVHELDRLLALQPLPDVPPEDANFHYDETLEGRADYLDGADHLCIGFHSLTENSLRKPLPVLGMGCLMEGFSVHLGAQYAGRKDDEF